MATIENFINDVDVLLSLKKDELSAFKEKIRAVMKEIDPKAQPLQVRERIREIFGTVRFLDPLVFAMLVERGVLEIDNEKVVKAAKSVLRWFESEFPKEEFAPLHEILDNDSGLFEQKFAEDALPFFEVKRMRVDRFSLNLSKKRPFVPWIRLTLIRDHQDEEQVLELKWYDALWVGETLLKAVRDHFDTLFSVLPRDSMKWDLFVSKVEDVRRAVDGLASLIEAKISDSELSSARD